MTHFLPFLTLLAWVVSGPDSATFPGVPSCRLVKIEVDTVLTTTYGYDADGYVISSKTRFKATRRDSTGTVLPWLRIEAYRYHYDAQRRVVRTTLTREEQPPAESFLTFTLKPAATTKYTWNNGHIEHSEEYDADEQLLSIRTFGYDSAGRLSTVLLGGPNPLGGVLKDFQYDGSTTNPTRMRIGSRNKQGTDTWTYEQTTTYGPERAPEQTLRGLPFDLLALQPWPQNAMRTSSSKLAGERGVDPPSQPVSTRVNAQGYLTETRAKAFGLTSVVKYHLENCP